MWCRPVVVLFGEQMFCVDRLLGAMRNISPLTLVELSHASQSAQVCTANPHLVGTFTCFTKVVCTTSVSKSDLLSVYEILISYLNLLLRHWISPCSTPNAAWLLLYAVTLPLSFLRWVDKWYWDCTSHWMNWWLSILHMHTIVVWHTAVSVVE